MPSSRNSVHRPIGCALVVAPEHNRNGARSFVLGQGAGERPRRDDVAVCVGLAAEHAGIARNGARDLGTGIELKLKRRRQTDG